MTTGSNHLLNGFPLQEKFLGSDDNISKVWLGTLAEYGDALIGDWGDVYPSNFTLEGVNYSDLQITGNIQKDVLCFTMILQGVTCPAGSTVSFSDLKFDANPNVLDLYNKVGDTYLIQEGIYIAGTSFKLPVLADQDILVKGFITRN